MPRNMLLQCILFLVLTLCTVKCIPPNIILIVADDLGWDDVGFHGSDIKTPNIDTLAYDGIILNNYYAQPICTPSRSALMSGRHPIHTGLQHSVILSSQPYGLDLNNKLLPNHLKDVGYATHMVGKWHLGFQSWNYTPTFRGFDSHYGYYMGKQDYWDHTNSEGVKACCWGLDFHDDKKLVKTEFGQYSTKIYEARAKKIIKDHDTSKPLFLYLPFQAVHSGNDVTPLEAPQEYVDRFNYIPNKNRRIFAGMVSALDDAIGNITQTLHSRGMLENSVIVFTTDNGGPAGGFDVNMACNWPLRGLKSLLWEGGIRGSAFLWSPLLKKSRYVSKHMMQIFDWYPTLLSIAGYDMGSLDPLKIDGMDMWRTLSGNESSRRTEMLHNIDPISGQKSLRVANYKILEGESPTYWAGWYKPGEHGVAGVDYGKEKFGDKRDSYLVLNDTRGNHGNREAISADNVRHELSKDLVTILNSIGRKIPSTNLVNPIRVNCGEAPANKSTNCDSDRAPCLFDIEKDPCEYNNIADQYPHIVRELKQRLKMYEETMITPKNKHLLPDPKGFPVFNNWAWVPWINVTRV